MGSYKLLIRPSAAKELEGVPTNIRRRIAVRIQALANDPRPRGREKLSGQERYRVRQGAYRIIYSIHDETHSILVVKIEHRRDVYR
ncbi:MAG: type II toxin-antitoxin system RelE/ParE family toxin [SAR202 cluster bacterium]|nr:type II toxin-antitoxin system RelE/ParE family toxin [SAR202 cluster bacterium]